MTDVTCHEESNPSTPSRHFSKLHKPSFAQRHSEHSISNAFLSILLLSLKVGVGEAVGGVGKAGCFLSGKVKDLVVKLVGTAVEL